MGRCRHRGWPGGSFRGERRCPVLAVGAQAYLGDQVSRQLAHVASDVRGAVITESGHNIALENPSALVRAYLDFFAGQLIESPR